MKKIVLLSLIIIMGCEDKKQELMQRNKADLERINPNSFPNNLRYAF